MPDNMLTAPFPWYGGKRRWSEKINNFIGDVHTYSEPFSGSMAVLLSRKPSVREVVCDTYGFICNYYRAVKHSPDELAWWSDYPTVHQDLTARRYWLVEWYKQNSAAIQEDADFYDIQAAAWWAWCLSLWIGTPDDMFKQNASKSLSKNKVPHFKETTGGTGISRQRVALPDQMPFMRSNEGGQGVNRQRPAIRPSDGGQGINRQRRDLPDKFEYKHQNRLDDKIPHTTKSQGIARHNRNAPHTSTHDFAEIGEILSGSRLLDWMRELSVRLANVVILNRDWQSAVTPSVLGQTLTSARKPVGVFLDPPYLRQYRGSVYESDFKIGDEPAYKAYEWAVEHGKQQQYYIAYACRDGDFPVPAGWHKELNTFGGIKRTERRDNLDCVMFSPACLDPIKMMMNNAD